MSLNGLDSIRIPIRIANLLPLQIHRTEFHGNDIGELNDRNKVFPMKIINVLI